MTRTARSASLRSMLKDRSENKSGLNTAMRKNGGGAHNWGNLENERDLEFAGIDDGQAELDEELVDDDDSQSAHSDDPTSLKKVASPVLELSEEELAAARKVRMNALKNGVDLSAIARTSAAVSGSPPKTTAISDATSISSADSV
ncbi:hypothetical protein R3P38DRAFT_3309841 [Favolaschia claudopus]|uniref:Hyaluronan/mRNA-binding protein domain-containing protein n=1 Tax=Favolaschia claudopus TaxID=2862362 RepID=A0AAW0CVJ3_9AGAR